MYSAITDKIKVVKEKIKNIKPTIVPKPANGTPFENHKVLSIATITSDIAEQMKASLVIAFMGFFENESMP